LFHNWREFASRKAHSSDLAVLPVFKEPRPFSLPAGRGRKNTKSIDSMQMFLRFLPGHALWRVRCGVAKIHNSSPSMQMVFLEYVRLDLGHKSN